MKCVSLHLMFTVALLAGCASVGRKIDQSAVDKIHKGETNKSQVRALIGSPDTVSKDGSGTETWVYAYAHAVAKGESFIPIYGAFAGGVKTQHQSTTVQFGADGLVTRVTSTYGGQDLDRGLSTASKASLPDTENGKRPK